MTGVPGVGWRARIVLALAVTGIVGGIAAAVVAGGLQAGHQELTAIAHHRAQVLEAWFAERSASAGLSATSFPQAELYVAWREGGDLAARDRLFVRLTQFAAAGGFAEAALLGEDGGLLWSSADRPGDGLPWTVWGDGTGAGLAERVDGVGLSLDGTLHAVFLATLPTPGPEPGPVVAYRAHPQAILPARLARWATPFASGSVVAFRPVDGGVAGLAWPRDVSDDEPGAPPQLETWFLAGDDGETLAQRLARGELGALVVGSGRDHRGELVVGAGRELDATGWFVLAQVDRSDLIGGFGRVTAMALVVALLTYFAGLYLLHRFGRAQHAAIHVATERAQADRMHAERLLAAIADASPDAIFAKDLEGRYLFINRAGSDLVGRSRADVVGMSDRQLFPRDQAEALREAERELAETATVRTFEERLDTTAGERVFAATKGPLCDADGQVYGTFGISSDVTERRAAQQVLEDQAQGLADSVAELERFNRVLVDRELVMVALKGRLNAFARRLGEAEPYPNHDATMAQGVDGG